MYPELPTPDGSSDEGQTPTQPIAPALPAIPAAPLPPPAQSYPVGPYGGYGAYGGYGQYGYPPAYPYGPAQPAHSAGPTTSQLRRRALKVGAGVTAVVAVAALSFAAGTTRGHTRVVQGSSASSGTSNLSPFGQLGQGNSSYPNFGQSPDGSGSSGNGFGGGASGSGNSGTTATATAAQSIGVVDINTNLKYQGAAAAGTGMVLDSSGDVLTNNHVVDGATSIKVTVVSTGRTYTATLVGTDPTQDIAVIKLVNASGLTAANFGDSSTVKVGDTVIGVGNAGGTGGTPSAATGKVLALHQSITASDDGGSNAEKLPDVIVSDAGIQAGDSGGPLYNSAGQIVGIDTAANTSGSAQGFSIPINLARSLAGEILSGKETTSIHIGYPGFLGVSVSAASSVSAGATVAGVLSGGPAAKAGIVAGDRITRVGSATVASSTALTKVMTALDPGDRVVVSYVDASGHSHTVTVTLAVGPAD